MSKCRFGGAEGTEKSVFELMEWPSGEGWLHDESSCPCRVELKAHMSVSCRWARCAVEEGHDVERVTETLRAIRREKIDESASDVVGYGMVTRCHQHCGVPQISTSQSSGHSSCARKTVARSRDVFPKMVFSILPRGLCVPEVCDVRTELVPCMDRQL